MKKKLRPQGAEEEGVYEDPHVNLFPKAHFRQGSVKGSGQARLVDDFGKGRGQKSQDLMVSMAEKDELKGGSPNVATERAEGETADELKLVVQKIEDDLGPDGPRTAGTSHLTIKLKLPSRAHLEKDDGAAKSGTTDSSGAISDAAVANDNSDWCSKAHEVSSLPELTSDHAQTDPCDASSYYLRPKVSQWHLKASRMEAGISEPRFRQPFSRFPVLTGFHKGKRSSRRRLASQVKRKSAFLGSFTYLSGKPRQGGKYAFLFRPSDSLERANILKSKGAQLRDNVPGRQSHKRHHWDNGGLLESFGRQSKHMLVCKDEQAYTGARFQNGGLCAEPSSTSNITSLHDSICSSKGIKKERDFLSLANTPNCQVEGCQNELSNAREYYRRRKVCEWHSKASKVYVDNAEQRFCQQCSRFHILAEFDEGRRSCRRMLAGHNERRRKPQLSRVLSKRPMKVECTNSKVVQVYVRRKKRLLDGSFNLQVEKSNLEAIESL